MLLRQQKKCLRCDPFVPVFHPEATVYAERINLSNKSFDIDYYLMNCYISDCWMAKSAYPRAGFCSIA